MPVAASEGFWLSGLPLPLVTVSVVGSFVAGVVLLISCASVPVSIVSWLINFDNFIPH